MVDFEDMKAAPIIATVAVVAVVAIAAILVVVPMFQPQIREIELVMVDYGFNRPGFAPTLTVKAGEIVVVKLRNEGAHPHEFMVVPDKERALMMMKKIISEIDAENIPEEEKLEVYDEEHHHVMEQMMKMYDFTVEPANLNDAPSMIMISVEPGEEVSFRMVISNPGTYWYVCQEASGTWPMIHQERGMEGKLIVE